MSPTRRAPEPEPELERIAAPVHQIFSPLGPAPRTRRGLWLRCALLVLLVLGLMVGCLLHQAWVRLRPAPGDWTTTLPVGPLRVQVRTSTLIRWATSAPAARYLPGHTLSTRIGPLALGRDVSSGHLLLRCQPCVLHSKGWGDGALILNEGHMTVLRDGDNLRGTLSSGRIQARWRGTLSDQGLRLHIDLPPTPMREAYALFSSAIPEMQSAQIEGSVALQATLDFPSKALSVVPLLQGVRVQGLGTEVWGQATSNCAQSLPEVRPGAHSLLARAVIAAEDQRFFEHPGYDLDALAEALQNNQTPGARLRGASTLTQQLAKLLVTGDERSPLRKLRELLYAVEMEQTLGKARILDLYLAHAPWGPQICGATQAASRYFGKRPDRLSPAEAAWLAAMLHNPRLELRRWQASGQINRERAIWVGTQMQRVPKKQRARMLTELSQPSWPLLTPLASPNGPPQTDP